MARITGFNQFEVNNLTNGLVEYIGNKMPGFSQSECFQKITEKKKNENQYSTAVCCFLQESQFKYTFIREVQQLGNSTVDFGIYFRAKLIFTLEAKILPTPKGKDRNDFEYVSGNGGGMERFKQGKHGVDNKERLLPENGLIAYVKENDFIHWHKTINQWIVDANWDDSEKLSQVEFNKIGKLISKHVRQGNSLTLHHLWVMV